MYGMLFPKMQIFTITL